MRKIIKVIRSCETREQLSIAYEWAMKYFDKIGFRLWMDVIQPEIDKKVNNVV